MKSLALTRSTLVIVSLLSLPVKATPYYVNNCGDNTNCNGLSPDCWSQGVSDCAKKTIQAGMNLGQTSVDVINVAPGTYTGTGNRDLEFPRTGGVARAFTVKCEVRSQCTIDCGGGPSPNNHRGFFFNDDFATNASVVDGFRIINGYIDQGNPAGGGAIAGKQSAPTIQYCTIEDNKADYGGGMYFSGYLTGGVLLVPQFIGCVIQNNEALTDDGGGIWLVAHIDPNITRCRITGNKAPNGWGGGIAWSAGCDVRVTDTEISDNEAKRAGGGVWVEGKVEREQSSWLKRCTVRRNKVTGGTGFTRGGGGIHVQGFGIELHIVNCLIEGNVVQGADLKGGGLFIDGPGSQVDGEVGVRVVNSKIVGNTAANGAGICVSSYPGIATTIEDCTIANNEASTIGGGIRWDATPLTPPLLPVQNLIAWGNTPEQLSETVAGKLDVAYSDISGGWTGTGNIDSNPLFIRTPSKGPDGQWGTADDDYGDLRLTSSSPCVDVGSNALLPDDDADIDDDAILNEVLPLDKDLYARVVNTIVDMGAYEGDACTNNEDCGADEDECDGDETCQEGNCVVLLDDCNLTGIDDDCELVTILENGGWKSVVTHGASNTIGLEVYPDSTFSESRNGGVTKLRVSFSGAIDSTTVSPDNVTVCGNDVNNQPVNLSGITVSTTVLSGNTVVDIDFSPKLPDYARYRVRLNGVEDLACHTITTNNYRIFTSLFCDATGDRRVNATDLGLVRGLEGTSPPIDPNAPNGTQQVRSDVDNDDDVDTTDTDLVRGEIPKDARYIEDPCP